MILHIFMYNVISDFSAVTPASEGRVNVMMPERNVNITIYTILSVFYGGKKQQICDSEYVVIILWPL